jgi:hypothetical protein
MHPTKLLVSAFEIAAPADEQAYTCQLESIQSSDFHGSLLLKSRSSFILPFGALIYEAHPILYAAVGTTL